MATYLVLPRALPTRRDDRPLPPPTAIGERPSQTEKLEGPSSPLNGQRRIPLNLFFARLCSHGERGKGRTLIMELACGGGSEQGRCAMARSDKATKQDVALLYAPTEDGKGARVIRARDGTLETGEVRPVQDGQPLNQGQLVRLSPRPGAPCVCDVDVVYQAGADERPADPPSSEASRGRPAQVANDDYRASWDRIFGAGARRSKRGDPTLN